MKKMPDKELGPPLKKWDQTFSAMTPLMETYFPEAHDRLMKKLGKTRSQMVAGDYKNIEF